MSEDMPTYEMVRVKRGSIRARIVLAFGLMTLAMLVPALDPQVLPGCQADASSCSGASLIWLFLAFWPGAVTVGVAFISWVATGRPW